MTTSTPPAWKWRDECDVPLLSFDSQETPVSATLSKQNDGEALSGDSCIPSDAATLGVQNDSSPDPTYRGCRPSERYPSDEPERAVSTTASGTYCVDQCSECRCPPGQPHAPGCDVSCSPIISCDRKDYATWCDEDAKVTHAHSNAAPSHRIGTCYLDPDTGETVMPGDFFSEKELRWRPDKSGNRHDAEPLVTVAESCPECGAVTDIDYGTVKDKPPDCQAYGKRDGFRLAHEAPANLPVGARNEHPEADTIPLWKQALWLARHIESLRSPRPDVVSDDELRGMTLIRVLGIGADEHGDEVFRKGSSELHEDRAEEWSDGEFYDLVDRFGGELGSARYGL